jgi:2-haloacid dehalogenase
MAEPKINGIVACVFDAYGTLFDVHSAAERCRDDLGEKADQVSNTWRMKQLQYSWLRSLMREFAPFWQVTGDALDFALAEAGLEDAALREKLMNLYLQLNCYPEVPSVLKTLKENGLKTGILSNGSRDMLDSAVANSNLSSVLDASLSVDDVGVFKVDPRVYEMATKRFSCSPAEICFMSSNAWDAWAASHFGFQVAWVNRFGQPREHLPGGPKAELKTLDGLPPLLGL